MDGPWAKSSRVGRGWRAGGPGGFCGGAGLVAAGGADACPADGGSSVDDVPAPLGGLAPSGPGNLAADAAGWRCRDRLWALFSDSRSGYSPGSGSLALLAIVRRFGSDQRDKWSTSLSTVNWSAIQPNSRCE